MSMNENAKQAQADGQVQQQLYQLERVVAETGELVEHLERKLVSVLRTEDDSKNSVVEQLETDIVPLANSIHAESIRLTRINKQFMDIIARVEV